MSFWDNVKKFAKPYSDEDDYSDDYEDEVEEYEEEEQEAAPRSRRTSPFADTSYSAPAATATEILMSFVFLSIICPFLFQCPGIQIGLQHFLGQGQEHGEGESIAGGAEMTLGAVQRLQNAGSGGGIA